MDKCSNNFVFVCKKFYVSYVFFELNSHVGTYVAFDLSNLICWIFITLLIRPIILRGKFGLHLSLLYVVWKFHKNPIKITFICASNSTSLIKVSKWLCFFFKAMFLVVNDLWVSKLKNAYDPNVSSLILNDFIGVVDGGNK